MGTLWRRAALLLPGIRPRCLRYLMPPLLSLLPLLLLPSNPLARPGPGLRLNLLLVRNGLGRQPSSAPLLLSLLLHGHRLPLLGLPMLHLWLCIVLPARVQNTGLLLHGWIEKHRAALLLLHPKLAQSMLYHIWYSQLLLLLLLCPRLYLLLPCCTFCSVVHWL